MRHSKSVLAATVNNPKILERQPPTIGTTIRYDATRLSARGIPEPQDENSELVKQKEEGLLNEDSIGDQAAMG